MNSLFWTRSFWFCTALLTMLAGGNGALGANTPVAITTQPTNQVATELLSATFVVVASGSPIPQYQWYKNGNAISNATTKTLSLFPVQLSDDGALFQAVAFNIVSNAVFSSATSSVASLSVTPDTTPPALVSASGLYPTLVYVLFSKAVRIDTATNLANYSITSSSGSLGISNAMLLAGSTTVALATAPQAAGTVYTLTVNGIVTWLWPRTWLPPTARQRSPRRIIQARRLAPRPRLSKARSRSFPMAMTSWLAERTSAA